MQVFRLQHSVHTHHHTRAPVPVRSPVVLAPPQQCRRVAVAAKKRKLNRDYEFVEVYQGVIAKLRERNHLSVRDMTQLIECIKTVEEASRCLDILAAFLATKADQFANEDALTASDDDTARPGPSSEQREGLDPRWLKDWPFRKRFLTRIAEIAIVELRRPELAFAIINNAERFKLSTYFGKELILDLGQDGAVPLDILGQIARLVQQRRGPLDKGTKGAWMAVLQVSQDRGAGADTVASIQSQLKKLREEEYAAAESAAAKPALA